MNSTEQKNDGCGVDCHGGRNCHYVGGGDVHRLIDERDYFKERVDEMEAVMGLAKAEIEKLRQEKEEITQQKGKLEEENKSLNHRLKEMTRKIFKPRVKRHPDGDRPKRGAPVGHRGDSRHRPEITTETEIIDINPEKCDRCGGKVDGYPNTFEEHVQVDVEIKRKVIRRRYHHGYCRRCQKVVYPKRDETSKRDRIGTGARAVAGYMRHLDLTYRKTARFFKNILGIDITHPSLLNFNTEQAENGAPIYEGIKQSVRNSSSVNADETGWRNDGNPIWLWVFATKDAVLYHFDKSLGGKVVINILGEKYEGVLISDFLSVYNEIEARAKQRCLGHFLKDVKEVQERNAFPPDSVDGEFCVELKKVLKKTIEVWNKYREGTAGPEELVQTKDWVVQKMVELVQRPLEHKDAQRLRNRIIRHNEELFIFLDEPSVEPTNNRAERQLRPMVIKRKLTFGSRSDSGASNEAVIMSIVETGVLNGVEPLDIFRALSTRPLTSFVELPEPRSPP